MSPAQAQKLAPINNRKVQIPSMKAGTDCPHCKGGTLDAHRVCWCCGKVTQ